MDNCLERMYVADAEAPRPPRIETGVEEAARVQVDTCPERMHAVRRFFCCTRKKQELKAAGEC